MLSRLVSFPLSYKKKWRFGNTKWPAQRRQSWGMNPGLLCPHPVTLRSKPPKPGSSPCGQIPHSMTPLYPGLVQGLVRRGRVCKGCWTAAWVNECLPSCRGQTPRHAFHLPGVPRRCFLSSSFHIKAQKEVGRKRAWARGRRVMYSHISWVQCFIFFKII